jgi:PII-like signaling protein
MARKPKKFEFVPSAFDRKHDAVDIKQEDTGGAYVHRQVIGLGDGEEYHTAKVTAEGGLAVSTPAVEILEAVLQELKVMNMHLNHLTELER